MENRKTIKTLLVSAAVLLVAALLVFVINDSLDKKPVETQKYCVAMGTVITEKIYSDKDASDVCDGVEKTIKNLEGVISRRDESSVIYSLNKNGKVKTDEKTADVISRCGEIYSDCGGAFDITVGKLTSMWNIGEENARVPEEKEIKDALTYVDGSLVKTNQGAVMLGEGQKVDLGAVGKGLACDYVRDYLETTPIKSAVISVGGSVLLFGDSEKDKKWSVAVRDPSGESDEYMGVLSLSDCCVSTSGDYERVLESDGKKYHHILDPKTGYPSDSGLKSVTIVCDSGFLSDALSTACFVLGVKEGEKLLRKYNAEAVFIDNENRVYVTDGLISSFSLTSEGYTLAGE